MNVHASNEEEDLTSVEHTHGDVMTRRGGENDYDQPPAARVRVETLPQPRWTWYDIAVVVEGAYESVYNATWHYVEGVGGEGFGMQVKEGHPPQLWTDDEVRKGSVEDDNDNENPEDGRLELMVLTSEKGWSYTEFSMEESCDIYVNKEVMRVWYKIL
ncbi:putative retrotransposon hot spot (RHS) protein, partial [Trypanosoma theileri]